MKKQIDKDKNLPQQLSQEQLDILKKVASEEQEEETTP